MYDFDSIPMQRVHGNCKWSVPDGVIPMGVADSDFSSPPQVGETIAERVKCGLFGYQVMTDDDYNAIINWRKNRHGEELQREWIVTTNGVLNTMRAAIYAMTEPGDSVIVMTPLHTPSITSASMRGRVCVDVPMLCENGRYTFDLDGIDRAFKAGAKMLALCSPSNPTGRVWTYEELKALADIVIANDKMVLCDEIHCDIIYPGNKFIPLRTIEGMGKRTVCTFSPSKSFNFGGFHIATLVCEDDVLRQRIQDIMYEAGICCSRPGAMEITAQTAVYTQGEEWLDALLSYLSDNIDIVIRELADTPLKVCRPEASILMWVDCSNLGWDTAQLYQFMAETGVSFEPGHYFFMDNHHIDAYTGPQTHFRMNIGAHRQLLIEALARIKRYFNSL